MNLVSPSTVRDLHAAYASAGAGVITTNSFGGSRTKLAKDGLAGMTAEINLAAARLAREGAGESRLVQGNIGPLGDLLEPLGDLPYERAVEIFREQAEALAEGGVDFFLVQTMFDLNEARAAIEATRRTGLPAVCTMTFDTGGRTMMGISPARAVAELRDAGAVAVGANCGVGPRETLEVLQEMHRTDPSAWLSARPNAGVPAVEGGKTLYNVTAEETAGFVPAFLEAGARTIGSCCGSSPEYTRAIAQALNQLRIG
jgi:5-methyltetrahydrofolate--homocysteine methyltransferase